jgi:hypothetical protein
VRVSHSHGDCLVTEKLLDPANVHPGHDEAAGKCVPQAVPTKIRDLPVLEYGLKPTPWLSGATADAFRGWEPLAESVSSALTAA